MSMSISAMNYYNESLQNKQNGTKSMTEKTKEKDMKQAEYRENWGTVQVTQEKYREDGTVSEEPLSSDAARKDRVMISKEGRQASIQMRQQGESVDTLSNNSTVQQMQEETSEETENQVEDLSEYTDAELKQMYYRGEITLQEYEDETGEIIE